MVHEVRHRMVGREAVLLEVEDPLAWYADLAAARTRGDLVCDEIVPAAETVLITGITDPAVLRHVFQQAVPEGEDGPGVEHGPGDVVIAVRWDGADLDETAERWGRDPAQVLRETVFTVAFCGFSPGWAYLTGLPEEFHLPRRATPRPAVPAGSVSVAGPYAGIYPRESPGGWHLLGQTGATLFDIDREPPSLLLPGMTVRMIDA
jgi:KipI family sensor histidine kinase inhibitor